MPRVPPVTSVRRRVMTGSARAAGGVSSASRQNSCWDDNASSSQRELCRLADKAPHARPAQAPQTSRLVHVGVELVALELQLAHLVLDHVTDRDDPDQAAVL